MNGFADLQSLLALADSDPASHEGRQKIHAAWRADLDQTPARAALYYSAFHDAITALIGNCRDGSDLTPSEAAAAMAYVSLFANGGYLGKFSAKSAIFEQLGQYHTGFLACLSQLRGTTDCSICPPLPFAYKGKLSDVVNSILRLYSAHVIYGTDRTIELQGEIQPLCPDLLAAFPAPRYPAALTLLDNHPDFVPAVAGLVRARLMARALDGEEGNPLWDIGGRMLGYHARRDDPLHAKAAAIIAQALKSKPSLGQDHLTILRDGLVLGPLDMRAVTQDKAHQDMTRNLAIWEKQIERDPSAGQSTAFAQKRLAAAQRAESLIRTDFDLWLDQRLVKAARHLAVSKAVRKAVDVLAAGLPAPLRAPLDAMTARADVIALQPVVFALPKSPDTAFRDTGLKLLVIEELMYRRSLLVPRFDIHAFAVEYTKRQISVEDDGYQQIPEVLRYFKALPIAPALLEQVTSLHQSSGLDGGPAYMQHLHPFWDPGAGDMPVKVTAKAIDDLALLPALTRITGLENSAPGAKLRAALKARGIACLPEDARH